nr:chitobiase/beta-hexosaminidase C-terminal domain-containing protein [Paenibacillus xylanexedens]
MHQNPGGSFRKKVKKRGWIQTTAIMLVVLQLFGLFGLSGRTWADSVDFAGGSGTQNDPWLIETPEQLDNIRTLLYPTDHPDYSYYYYKLIADIDLDVAPYNQGAGWDAIGTSGAPFTGNFDGNGHIISNMKINLQDERYKLRNGLFGATKDATFRNLGLENSVVSSGSNFAGSFIGEAISNTNIIQVYAIGSVRADNSAGGLIGLLSGPTTIEDSYFMGSAEARVGAGGLVGSTWGDPLQVKQSYAAAEVKAQVTVTAGGLIGDDGGKDATITSSYYDQDISGISDTKKGQPLSSSAMRQQQTYSDWSFVDPGIWSMDENKNDGYPYLKFQNFTDIPTTWTDITGKAVLSRPLGIAVDNLGNLYVVNYQSNKIMKYSNETKEWTDITGTESFNYPTGVAVDNFGNVYVADRRHYKIKKRPVGSSEWLDITGTQNIDPNGIAVDSEGNLYAADGYGKIKSLLKGEENWVDITGTESFSTPYGIAIDGNGSIYVTDTSTDKIKKRSRGASEWIDITTRGNFSNPASVAVDNTGTVYVADANTNKIKRLKNGAVRWENITGSESFLNPYGMATDRFNNVYVTDLEHSKLKKLSMTPAASPSGGIVTSGTTVTLTIGIDGATIYYTTDGTEPTINNGMIYSSPIPVTDGMTIRAIAIKKGMEDSQVISETYTFKQQVGKPTADSAGGAVAPGTTVKLTSTTDDATIYFTTDGSIPSMDNGTLYSGPIPVTDGMTIRAIAIKPGMEDSQVLSESYTIKQPNVEPGGNSSGGTGSGGSAGGASNAPSTPASTVAPNNNQGFSILVEGKQQEGIASASSTKENGKTLLTVKVDTSKLTTQLAKTEDKPVIVIPVTSKEDNVSTILTGDAIKQLENKQATLEIRTPAANYTLPAAEVLIDQLAKQLGQQVKLADITLHVDILANDSDKSARINNEASKKGFTVVAPPVDFKVTASYDNKTIEVNKFGSYVVREIALPDSADLNKIATAVVMEDNGAIRHVPTYVTTHGGKHYAVVNSLTNSTYSLIWHPITFSDVEFHWAKAAVDDMASRMVVNGVDAAHFNPDAAITRAEFAAIMVRALGLPDQTGSAPFNDVSSSDWYVGAVAQAQQYGIIQGYADDMFHPSQTITREEAVVILERAMRITGLENKVSTAAPDNANASPAFKDAQYIASWSNSSIIKGLQAGLITGRATGEFAPKASITRAEVAVIIQRLMTKSGLI